MKPVVLVLVGLLWLPSTLNAADHEVVVIAVSGLACPFCAYGLEKNLKKLADVDSATVDLAASTVRISIKPGQNADLDAIREAIVNAGFTPGEVRAPEEEE
ncbi:MAG: heavy-metal-associated domain-containing protein [Woeseia sp.]|nr:cation transporter [Gammaproteobacteria bacterium]NNE62410.1 heavy-metal-associated domain-containing protein [Woeseia sp.]